MTTSVSRRRTRSPVTTKTGTLWGLEVRIKKPSTKTLTTCKLTWTSTDQKSWPQTTSPKSKAETNSNNILTLTMTLINRMLTAKHSMPMAYLTLQAKSMPYCRKRDTFQSLSALKLKLSSMTLSEKSSWLSSK